MLKYLPVLLLHALATETCTLPARYGMRRCECRLAAGRALAVGIVLRRCVQGLRHHYQIKSNQIYLQHHIQIITFRLYVNYFLPEVGSRDLFN
jgi:hypothetical protein